MGGISPAAYSAVVRYPTPELKLQGGVSIPREKMSPSPTAQSQHVTSSLRRSVTTMVLKTPFVLNVALGWAGAAFAVPRLLANLLLLWTMPLAGGTECAGSVPLRQQFGGGFGIHLTRPVNLDVIQELSIVIVSRKNVFAMTLTLPSLLCWELRCWRLRNQAVLSRRRRRLLCCSLRRGHGHRCDLRVGLSCFTRTRAAPMGPR